MNSHDVCRLENLSGTSATQFAGCLETVGTAVARCLSRSIVQCVQCLAIGIGTIAHIDDHCLTNPGFPEQLSGTFNTRVCCFRFTVAMLENDKKYGGYFCRKFTRKKTLLWMLACSKRIILYIHCFRTENRVWWKVVGRNNILPRSIYWMRDSCLQVVFGHFIYVNALCTGKQTHHKSTKSKFSIWLYSYDR